MEPGARSPTTGEITAEKDSARNGALHLFGTLCNEDFDVNTMIMILGWSDTLLPGLAKPSERVAVNIYKAPNSETRSRLRKPLIPRRAD